MYDTLYESLFEIVTFINRPTQDKQLLKQAGVSLDTALFPLFMRIGHAGPLGIGELADQVNRDYSTVSRQVDKMVSLGLVNSSEGKKDKRVRRITVSEDGRRQLNTIRKARRTLMKKALAGWSQDELDQLESSLGKLATTLKNI